MVEVEFAQKAGEGQTGVTFDRNGGMRADVTGFRDDHRSVLCQDDAGLLPSVPSLAGQRQQAKIGVPPLKWSTDWGRFAPQIGGLGDG